MHFWQLGDLWSYAGEPFNPRESSANVESRRALTSHPRSFTVGARKI